MGKVKRFEPISATYKDCGRDFIITAEEQKRFKSLGFELPKRCCECRKKWRLILIHQIYGLTLKNH